MLTFVEEPFDESPLDTYQLTIAAADDDALNQHVSETVEARRISCNVIDAPKAANFTMPSIINCSSLIVAVFSGGIFPVLARLLREELESLLLLHLGQVTKYAGQLRERVKQQFATMGERRRFWEKSLANDRLVQSLANSDREATAKITERLVSGPFNHRGEVVLVGASPGDAGLLTLKGLQRVQQADVMVHDRLVSNDIMNLVRRDADRAFIGKHVGYCCVPQEEINQILLRGTQKGKYVVRLKGDDPFIFGCGGEELETLCNADIPFSVAPGTTTVSGRPAYSGIPLTYRDYAQDVCLITGHLETDDELDWENLAAKKQTLVFYMGLSQATTIQQKLVEYGVPDGMPIVIVGSRATVAQCVIDGTFTQLGELAQQMNSPSLITTGRAVGLRDKLNWFSNY